MAEPLKNHFGTDIPVLLAEAISTQYPEFPTADFLAFCTDGFHDLELTPRARRIADGFGRYLPSDRGEALRILIASLGAENPSNELTGMEPFRYLPHVFFVAEYGLDHFELAMTAQAELTKRFTSEFSIRAFIEHDRERTLEQLRRWADDENVHLRRLVSEGTRPRLPWAPRLKEFQQDPEPVLELLELLKDDPEEYVRRSVANNLNDIAKDHPELAVEVAGRWWSEGDAARRKLVRHGLRTLIKKGNLGALDVLGYGPTSPARPGPVTIVPSSLAIGDKVKLEAVIENPSARPARALVDISIHFVKANGSTSPKVFKGGEVEIAPGATATVRKTVSIAQHSTRTHYPGTHRVDLLVNGTAIEVGSFEVTD
ncbi:MAG: DNA alkylation repair protein [Actinomycetia bacterium]|nr:DNA alkylation repair protein [Actinomycetes bacterium]